MYMYREVCSSSALLRGHGVVDGMDEMDEMDGMDDVDVCRSAAFSSSPSNIALGLDAGCWILDAGCWMLV